VSARITVCYNVSDMPALTLQLSDEIRTRAAARATENGFDSVEAYVQALLLDDVTTAPVLSDDQLEPLLLGRLDGPFVDADQDDFRRMRQKLEAELDEGPSGTRT